MKRAKRHFRLIGWPVLILFAIGSITSAVLIFKHPPSFSAPEKYCVDTEVRRLPGGFNDRDCFNSNSPELVLSEGILLSTFPAQGMRHPEAHLNHAFEGEFNLFSHHVAKNEDSEDDRCLYLGYVMGNRTNRKIKIEIQAGASYLSQPDAPFISLPEVCLNDDGKVFAGPGDRVALEVLRGQKPANIPESIVLEAGETRLVFTLPVPVRHLKPALNGRSTLLKLKSNGPVYIAGIAKFSKRGEEGVSPSAAEYLSLLTDADFVRPRDEAPTPPAETSRIRYGRVAGIQHGTRWSGVISDKGSSDLKIPEAGQSISYPISTVSGGTFGTNQVQSAELPFRYPDTAYQAHGNYGVEYDFALPLTNESQEERSVQVLFQSALKSNEKSPQVCFYNNAAPRAFFRGSIRVRDGSESKFWHLVQKQGAEGAKIAEFKMPPNSKHKIEVSFIYPADATPPQELTIKSNVVESDSN